MLKINMLPKKKKNLISLVEIRTIQNLYSILLTLHKWPKAQGTYKLHIYI